MASYDNTYSRVVAWLKIILPLMALGLLSTLFLLARPIDPAKNIPYSDVDIEELTREQRISNPNYSGVTAAGAAVRLKAQRARPDPDDPGRIIGTGVDAAVDLPDGRGFDVTAPGVVLDNTRQIARLNGGVLVIASQGAELRTEALELALKTTRVTSSTETVVETDTALLTSGGFEMTGDGTDTKPYLVVFNNGVRLIYEPEGGKGP